jgi:hypothetical protein
VDHERKGTKGAAKKTSVFYKDNVYKMSLRWTDGTICEKSPRKSLVKEEVETTIQVEAIKENTAYLQSLDEGALWAEPSYLSQGQSQSYNKREASCYKISEREMITQIGQNPFLGNNSYIKALDLKAIPTHFDKPEFTEGENLTYSAEAK